MQLHYMPPIPWQELLCMWRGMHQSCMWRGMHTAAQGVHSCTVGMHEAAAQDMTWIAARWVAKWGGH